MATSSIARAAPNGISVLVCGGGVGGLMSALECWRRGFDVRIFEKSNQNLTTGDSFVIGPTATQAFRRWPFLESQNESLAYRPLVAYHKLTGERVGGPIAMEDQVATDEPRGRRLPFYRHSRPKFHSMLLQQLNQIGVQLEYGKEAVEYLDDEQRGLGVVRLKDGTSHEADLVIAADGVGGKSSSLVTGAHISAKSSGDAIFRVAFPVEYALADPLVAERFPLNSDGRSISERWVGDGAFAAFWRNEDQMSIGIQHPDKGTAEESWSHQVPVNEILRYTATIPGWPEVADRAIKTIPSGQVMDYKLVWRDPQPNWVSPAGRVVQVGDAAHTFLPTSANGATQAMEDAVSLAACLSLASSKDKIPQANRIHNLLRFERVSCMQAFGVDNRKKVKTELKMDSTSKKPPVMFPKWIVLHDPEAYALERYAEALSHLDKGTPFQNTNIPPGITYKPWTIDGLLKARKRGEPTVLDGDWS